MLCKFFDYRFLATDTSSEVSIKDVQKRLIYVRSIRRGYTYNASCEGCQDGTEKLFDFVLLIGYRCVNPSMSPPARCAVLFSQGDKLSWL
ncbi:hypothetical protein MRX96_020417 [Rhipicephalus microplus]